jgi:hypothetical protein
MSPHIQSRTLTTESATPRHQRQPLHNPQRDCEKKFKFEHHIKSNDPAAGSPTATLLRLLPGSSHCD